MTRTHAFGQIVVGVSGSAASRAALAWAAAEAGERHAELVAVRAWQPTIETLAPYASTAGRPSPEQDHDRADDELTATVEHIIGHGTPVKVHQVLIRDRAARALLDQALSADLLVLGGHHTGSPMTPTVGAVAAACLRHAHCPVVLVSPTGTDEPGTSPARHPAATR